ncbi:hypothetical protein [Oceanimonas baumannii]|uniref:Uncharacterized protein n=1 Tax=Oceanimonas baumannii TaxID=129578 RepID=A0ABY2F1T2_9GAMM|nr:hypothetical protein [Oceanimonas baumannii]TDW61387.1 hypothetical protein LY04_00925 [Oceanimonas baumannii]
MTVRKLPTGGAAVMAVGAPWGSHDVNKGVTKTALLRARLRTLRHKKSEILRVCNTSRQTAPWLGLWQGKQNFNE